MLVFRRQGVPVCRETREGVNPMLIQVETEWLERISERFSLILRGKVPELIELPADYPDDEFRQAVGFINRFLAVYDETTTMAYRLSHGEIGVDPPKGATLLLQSLKNLQATMRNLTWTTQQIARGDFSQRVNFMGDFSEAFNSMASQLHEAFQEIERSKSNLQDRINEHARARRAMLNIMEDLKEVKQEAQGAS